jgi:DNA-binding SARP family transcriptional activator/tetratricopeptide (TPR) repeat protein
VGNDIVLRLLGPVEVRSADAWQQPGTPQQRLVLGLLAMRAGYAVPFDELAAAMWDGEPPRSARNSVQVVLSHLRKAVTVTGEAQVRRCGDGYRLDADPNTVDVYRFRRLAKAGRGAQDARWAVTAFDEALGLWRGPALADAADSARAEQVRSGLAGERLAVLEDQASALLRCGRHADVAEQLPGLLAENPLRERLAGMLMVALYQCGQQAEALAVFRATRTRLAGELGIEPGPELQHLHQRILAGDPGLAVPPTVRAPYLPLLADVGGTAAGGRVQRVVPRQLPTAPLRFAGRTAELEALTRLAGRAGDAGCTAMISVIGGSAGVGKTALALHWAHQVAHRFPDGQLYVDLRGYGPSGTPVTPAGAICGFLDALGVPAGQVPAEDEAKVGLYRSLMAGRRMLIVLDNARDEAQVRPLLPGSPTCVVLVTGRSQFAGLVAVEGARPLTLDVLSEAEARQLLASHLGAERVAAEAAEAAELTALCAGLPLALAITAAWAALRPAFPLASVTAGLRDVRQRLDWLDAGDQAADVRAVFSWSYRVLGEPAARMFRLLGAHPGPDISEAAAASLAAVCGPAARAALSELVRANLLQEQAPGRFSLHDLLHAYAAGLGDEKERRSAIGRVLDHYLNTARAAVPLVYPHAGPTTTPLPGPGELANCFADPGQARAWLQAEFRVLVAATAAAADNGFDTRAWQLPAVLREHFDRGGYYSEWAQCQQLALAAADRLGRHDAQAHARRFLGRALIGLGRLDEAHGHLRDALKLYCRLGDHAGQGWCHFHIGHIFELREDHRRALSHDLQALRLSRAAGDLGGEAFALGGAGWHNAHLGNYQQALSYCGKALELHRKTDNQVGEALTLDSLAYCCHQAGDYGQAVAYYQQALRAYTAAGDRYFRALTLIHLGEAHLATGHREATSDAWQQALAILDDIHYPDAAPIRAKLHDLTAPAPPPSCAAASYHPAAHRRHVVGQTLNYAALDRTRTDQTI